MKEREEEGHIGREREREKKKEHLFKHNHTFEKAKKIMMASRKALNAILIVRLCPI